MKKRNNYFSLDDVKRLAKEYNLPFIDGLSVLESMLRLNKEASEKDYIKLAEICSTINKTPSLKNPKTKSDLAKKEKLIGKYSEYFDFANHIVQELKDKKFNNKKSVTSTDDVTER